MIEQSMQEILFYKLIFTCFPDKFSRNVFEDGDNEWADDEEK